MEPVPDHFVPAPNLWVGLTAYSIHFLAAEKFSTVKDIANVLNKTTSNNSPSQNTAVRDLLNEIKLADLTAAAEVNVSEQTNALKMIFIASSSMKDNFQKYGQVVFFDTTYKLKLENFCLYVFLIQDIRGTG
ncbi:unnamed protein product [Didymodactylos carnosus]|uniref:ZSWIM1/3 RNaseH-like domain-containing protein n=1 Tax=Didymodactylos carnosus TaxID=1234261 RepID=A0A815FDS6_9BILA|nr:unnamed protein product [Didymodactylos carnosus]CAF1325179.1 unnamed protein product [Didymodactylos carnosus]CAF4011897.1 unnamed protein product [Didymodactylos carnosus]CAF4174351.1 unnamed protein product [Didymodactylos carnosus]